MTDHETKQEAVQKAANAFAAVERAHEALKPLYDDLKASIVGANAAGVVRQTEGVGLLNDIEDARGRNASALAKVLKVHDRGTKIAKREKCDVPPNLAIDGGLVTVMSGGDR